MRQGQVVIRDLKHIKTKDFVRLGTHLSGVDLWRIYHADGKYAGLASPRELKPLYPKKRR
jgi:hypothetical protein